MQTQKENITYSCSWGTIEKKSIVENVNPFRGEFPDHVIRLRKACDRFIDAESDDGKMQVAEETGYNYNFLKGFCRNKHNYRL